MIILALYAHKLETNTTTLKLIQNKEEEEFLYVILTYFNFAHSKRRKQLFLEFVDYLHEENFSSPSIRIVIIEALLNKNAHNRTNSSTEFELPNLNENRNRSLVYLQYKYKLLNIFWCKENLINFASKFFNLFNFIDPTLETNNSWITFMDRKSTIKKAYTKCKLFPYSARFEL